MAVSAFHESHRSHHAEVAQINITPLVDVMLVLLVIFMVATPMMTGRIDLRLPGVTDRNLPTPPPPTRVELRVDGAGRFVLDGVALTRDELPQALRELTQAQPRTITLDQAVKRRVAVNKFDHKPEFGREEIARGLDVSDVELRFCPT